MKTTNNTQEVGGNHYQNMGSIEPVHLMVLFNLNWFQGEIIKYISRHWNKNGVTDLNKALHICDMAYDFNLSNATLHRFNQRQVTMINNYCKQFKDYFSSRPEASIRFNRAICLVINGLYKNAFIDIQYLKTAFYEEEPHTTD